MKDIIYIIALVALYLYLPSETFVQLVVVGATLFALAFVLNGVFGQLWKR